MSNLKQIPPASKADVIIYKPYYEDIKLLILPYAIGLYQQGRLEGERKIEGGENIPFVATWFVSKLPSQMTSCRLQFDRQAELSYELTILNSEFIEYLMEVIIKFKEESSTDFPQIFYKKLLRIDE